LLILLEPAFRQFLPQARWFAGLSVLWHCRGRQFDPDRLHHSKPVAFGDGFCRFRMIRTNSALLYYTLANLIHQIEQDKRPW